MGTSAVESDRHQRNADIAANMPLVRLIAGRIRRRLPASVGMDELVQAGMIGLYDALTRFEEGRGSTFETYAARRIEGAMLDDLRANDTLPKESRARLREVSQVVHRLANRLGRTPRAKEVANELGWSLEKFHTCMVEGGAAGARSSDEELEHLEEESATAATSDHDFSSTQVLHADPARALQQRQRHAALSAAFDALEEAERYV